MFPPPQDPGALGRLRPHRAHREHLLFTSSEEELQALLAGLLHDPVRRGQFGGVSERPALLRRELCGVQSDLLHYSSQGPVRIGGKYGENKVKKKIRVPLPIISLATLFKSKVSIKENMGEKTSFFKFHVT